MVTKRKTARRAAPRRRVYAARRAAPRRRAKSGITYIPSAMATVALVAANADKLKATYNVATNYGRLGISQIPARLTTADFMRNLKSYVTVDNLTKSGIAVAGGYVAGEIVKKYAPGVIKRPLGKIAKKIPKVF